jgi:predicted  nucleic acid-binding Zn-ribbon protein
MAAADVPPERPPDMKRLIIAALLLGCAGGAGAQERLADQLRKGIAQEETGGSVEKAIPIYQAIVARFEQDRQAAATALFRLAECYRKAGKREPAIAAYERVVREFGDQAALVEASRKQLQASGVREARASREAEASRERVAELERQLARANREIEAAASRRAGGDASLAGRRERAANLSEGLSLEVLRAQLAGMERRLADARKRFHAGVVTESELQALTTEHEIASQRYREAQLAREMRQKVAQQAIRSLEAEALLVEQRIKEIEAKVSAGTISGNDAELLQLKRDLLSLQRNLAELKAGVGRS